jgi:hypothetical protein
MGKFKVILITATLFTAVTAEATGQMTYFATSGDTLYVLRDIYCFDYGGDYVTSFPAPAPNPVGLAWDGGYLWVSCYIGRGDVMVYQMATDGSMGPYDAFEAQGPTGLTIYDGYVVTLWGAPNIWVDFYTRTGSFIRTLELSNTWGEKDGDTFSMTTDGEYLWVSFYPLMSDFAVVENFDTETGDGQGDYLSFVAYSGLTSGVWSYTSTEVKSFGKIKAFFK